MTRRARILVELLVPAPVATLALALVAAAPAPRALIDPGFLGGVLVVVAFAYLFAAIPSALFALALELAFARGLDPASRGAVVLAALLGVVSGVAIAATFRGDGYLAAFAPIGALSGAAVGLLIRSRSRKGAPPRPGAGEGGADGDGAGLSPGR